MKIEKVIKQLESIADHTRSMAASPDADEIWKEDSDALEFAITALRSMQEAGEPFHIDRSKWEYCLTCRDLRYLPYEVCAGIKKPGGS